MHTDHIELRRAAEFKPGTIEFGSVVVSRIDLSELLAAYDALRAGATVKRGKKEYPAEFSAAYDAMKEAGAKWREGSTPAAAFKQWQARIKAGADPEQVLEGVRRYGAYIAATASEPKMAQTFFGPGEHYTAQWAIPAKAGTWPFPASSQGRIPRAQQQAMATAEALARLDGIPPIDLNTIDMEISNGSR